MRRLYEPRAYGSRSDEGCYWLDTILDKKAPYPKLSGAKTCEVAVVGAGYTGLTAALHLTRDAGADVAVLEAQTPGWGASGRNGGFACLGGSALDDRDLIDRHGLKAFLAFHAAERSGIDQVAEVLERYVIPADTHSKGETRLAHRAKDMDDLRQEVKFLDKVLGVKAELIEQADLAYHGLGGTDFRGAMRRPHGFALNPRKYAIGLAHAALSEGARIYSDTPVHNIVPTQGGFLLTTDQGEMRAKKLIVATNGYSSEDVPAWMAGRYLPVQSNIIVTRPISQELLAAQGWTSHQMAYDTRHLLHYFRLMPNRRFLFGMRGGVTVNPIVQAAMKRRILRHFHAMFPAWSDVEAPYFWSGLLSVSRNRTPYVGPIGDWQNAFTGLSYHGNGVAMGSYAGARLADLVTGRNTGAGLPDIMRDSPRKFPFGRARRGLLHLAYRAYQYKDRG